MAHFVILDWDVAHWVWLNRPGFGIGGALEDIPDGHLDGDLGAIFASVNDFERHLEGDGNGGRMNGGVKVGTERVKNNRHFGSFSHVAGEAADLDSNKARKIRNVVILMAMRLVWHRERRGFHG